MNTLRGIISLTMLSFLVAATGTWGDQALALAKPTVVRKKIQLPPQTRHNTLGADIGSLSPKADIAQVETVPSSRPTSAAKTTAAEISAKSDLAATSSDNQSPLKVAQKLPTSEPPPADRPEPLPLLQTEPVSQAVATAPPIPLVASESAVSPIPFEVSGPAAPADSQETPASEGIAPGVTVATITVTEDRPPSIVARTKDGDPLPYDPLGKIDPFEPLFKDEPEVAPAESKREKRIPRTPLENIDLGQLKLVGVILASSGNRALVQEASGKGYIIKEGTYIGVNSGKVTEIQNDRVIVEEEIEDVVGKPTIRNKELVLPKPPGE